MSVTQDQPSLDIVGESESRSEFGSSRSKKRSVVWNHFNMVGEEKVVCKHCGNAFTRAKGAGTSHLLRHISVTCKEIPIEERGKMITSQRDELFDPLTFKFDPELTRNLFSLLFIDAEIPFAAIESRFWEPTMRSLRSEYRAVGRKTVRNDCLEVFKAGRDATLAEFEKLDSRVSFTSDIWTSSNNLGYLCVTAHWIDNEFQFQKKIVAFKKIPYPHTGQAVANVIEQVWVDWKLTEKVFAITLDNASVNDTAVRLLEKKLSEKMLFGANHMHMRCSAHILNLIVRDGMRNIREIVDSIRELLLQITSSGSRLQALNAILIELNMPTKKGLVLDCSTRWNSTYEMLREALNLKDALLRYEETWHDQTVGPSEEKWKNIEDMTRFLEPFLDATKMFSHVRRPSSHTYVNEIWAIRTLLLDDEIIGNPLLGQLATRMQRKFMKYWQDPNLILAIATFFDPRYKLVFVDFCFRDAYGDGYEAKLDKVRELLKKFYEEYERSSVCPSQVSSAGSSQVGSNVYGKRKLVEAFAQFKSETRDLHSTLTELEKYEQEELLETNEDFDILQFWRRSAALYPTLEKMARDFLAVQTSSVASESAFNAAGRLSDHLRTSMNSETIEALVCSKDWFGPKEDEFSLDKYMHLLQRS